jgi:hypothetical protein
MTHSMTCEQFEHILPQLLDDESAAAALTPMARAHLDGCAACRSLHADLMAIRSEARGLPALVPERDLWSGIAARIQAPVVPLVEGVRARPARRQLSWRSAGIAAAALMVITTAITYQITRRTQAPPLVASALPAPGPANQGAVSPAAPASRPPAPASGSGTVEPAAVVPVGGGRTAGRPPIVLASNQPRQREPAEAVYDREISRLRAIVDSGRTRLDPATVALLDRNLRIIDLAIEQCRQALVRDSASTFLIESMNNAYQTKVKLLRVAAVAASRG